MVNIGHQKYKINAVVWISKSSSVWHFLTIPKNIAEEITFLFSEYRRGWGSLPVQVTLNHTTWKTSIFFDNKTSLYILPLKSAIRKKEGIKEGDEVKFILELKV